MPCHGHPAHGILEASRGRERTLDTVTSARLQDLLERQVVQIACGERFRGTGFLVAPDTVLTCAHVVARHAGAPIGVVTGDRTTTAAVVRMAPSAPGSGSVHPYPDLAELRLAEPLDERGVWLDDTPPAQGDTVCVPGFSGHTLEPGIQPDTLWLRVAGRSGRFVRLQDDQVVQGFSGGPVLNPRTGRVCGVLKASRSEKGVFGGWLIPVDAVPHCSPELPGANADAHRPGTPWFDLVRGRAERQNALFGPEPREGTGRSGRTTPAGMLARGAMPFVDRPELKQLQNWCLETDDVLVRLLYAPGGSGKTRLARELCRGLRDHGWIAGFADREPFNDPVSRARWLDGLADAVRAGFPALVVFDYAQARQDDICALLTRLHQVDEEMTLRVLLLGRSAEPLWQTLREALEDLGVEDWALSGASVHRLPGLLAGTTPESLAAQAFTEFARQLDRSWLPVPATLDERARARSTVLGVLACALDAVLTLSRGESWEESDDPLVRICRHETRGWHTALEDRIGSGGALAGRTGPLMTQGLLLVPTLARRRDAAELTTLLGRTREAAFPGQPPLPMAAVHTCLRALYPDGSGGVAPLEPDRIGEILIRRVLSEPESAGADGALAYLTAVLDVGRLPVAARTEAVLETLDALARARGCTVVGRITDHPAHPVLDHALTRVLEQDPALLPALAVTGGRVPHAEPLAGVMRPVLESCGPELLRTVEKHLPAHSSGLSEISALVHARLLAEPDTGDGEEERLARQRRLVRYSLRLDETGRRPEALDAAHEAMVLGRDLVRRFERHQEEYAAALNNLSLLRHRAGRTDDALELSVEAVALQRRLVAEGGPRQRRRLLDTATTLSTLALLRLGDEQFNGAAADAAEGVARCEQAGAGPRQQDVLLHCLEVLAECRHRVGLTGPALTASGQAVDLLRDLAERQPARYLSRLPDTLQRHGLGLIRAGRDREAYGALREAVQRRAVLPRTPARVRDQSTALRVLAALSGELDGLGHERSSWLRMLSDEDGLEPP